MDDEAESSAATTTTPPATTETIDYAPQSKESAMIPPPPETTTQAIAAAAPVRDVSGVVDVDDKPAVAETMEATADVVVAAAAGAAEVSSLTEKNTTTTTTTTTARHDAAAAAAAVGGVEEAENTAVVVETEKNTANTAVEATAVVATPQEDTSTTAVDAITTTTSTEPLTTTKKNNDDTDDTVATTTTIISTDDSAAADTAMSDDATTHEAIVPVSTLLSKSSSSEQAAEAAKEMEKAPVPTEASSRDITATTTEESTTEELTTTKSVQLVVNDATTTTNNNNNNNNNNEVSPDQQQKQQQQVLVLISRQSWDDTVLANQQTVETVFKSLGVNYTTLDGADPANKEKRDELFALSGLRGTYPQIFSKGDSTTTTNTTTAFWGAWDDFQRINDMGAIARTFGGGQKQPDIPVVASTIPPPPMLPATDNAPEIPVVYDAAAAATTTAAAIKPPSPTKKEEEPQKSAIADEEKVVVNVTAAGNDDTTNEKAALVEDTPLVEVEDKPVKVETIVKAPVVNDKAVDAPRKEENQKGRLMLLNVDARVVTGKHLLVLVALDSTATTIDAKVHANQQQTIDLLNKNNVKYKVLDGSDPVNKKRKNQLIFSSGIRAEFPQYFLDDDDDGDVDFWGTWTDLRVLDQRGRIAAALEDRLWVEPKATDAVAAATSSTTSSNGYTQKSQKHVLVLISLQSANNAAVNANQESALKILQDNKIRFRTFDGADPANKTKRNELFFLSGLLAQYPQFFTISASGGGTFWGDWGTFKRVHEKNGIAKAFSDYVDPNLTWKETIAATPTYSVAASPTKSSPPRITTPIPSAKPKTAHTTHTPVISGGAPAPILKPKETIASPPLPRPASQVKLTMSNPPRTSPVFIGNNSPVAEPKRHIQFAPSPLRIRSPGFLSASTPRSSPAPGEVVPDLSTLPAAPLLSLTPVLPMTTPRYAGRLPPRQSASVSAASAAVPSVAGAVSASATAALTTERWRQRNCPL